MAYPMLRLRALRAGLCTMVLMFASAHAAQIRLEASAFIEVQADGKHCAIRKVRLLCTEAIAHLKDILKLPAGAAVGVKAHQAAPYLEVRKMLDAVGESGFSRPVALVEAP